MSEQIVFKFGDCELGLYSDTQNLEKLTKTFMELLKQLGEGEFLIEKKKENNDKCSRD